MPERTGGGGGAGEVQLHSPETRDSSPGRRTPARKPPPRSGEGRLAAGSPRTGPLPGRPPGRPASPSLLGCDFALGSWDSQTRSTLEFCGFARFYFGVGEGVRGGEGEGAGLERVGRGREGGEGNPHSGAEGKK